MAARTSQGNALLIDNCRRYDHFVRMCTQRTDTTHLAEKRPTLPASDRRGVVDKGAEGGQESTGKDAVPEGEEIVCTSCAK